MSKTWSMQKNQRPEKTWKTAFEKRAGVLLQLYSAMSYEHSAVIPSVASNKTCLRTFNTIRCVSWLYWLEHSPVLPSLITKSFFHWLDRLLILPSLARSSFDLTFIGWIIFFWSYLHWIVFWSYLYWLDLFLILPLLVAFFSDFDFTILVLWIDRLKWDMTFLHLH